MDEFSQRFTNRLLAKHPEWRSAISWQDRYLFLEVSPPSGRAAWPLFVSTEGGEITVGFDRWHDHLYQFATDDEEQESSRAIELVEELLNEKRVVVSIMNGDKWAGSWTAASDEDPRSAGKRLTGSKICVRSWKGTHDQDIAI